MQFPTASDAEVREYRDQASVCDFVFVAEAEERLRVHSYILKRHSRFFASPANGRQPLTHMLVNDVTIEVVRTMCEIMYEGKVQSSLRPLPDSDDENLLLMAQSLAETLCLDSVARLITDFIRQQNAKRSIAVNTMTEDGKEPESEMTDASDASEDESDASRNAQAARLCLMQ